MNRRLNWVDYGILFTLIVVIFVLGLKIHKKSGSRTLNDKLNKKMNIILKLENVGTYYADALYIGDIVYTDLTDTPIGKIRDIKIDTAYISLIKKDGEIIFAKSPEKYDIVLNIEGNVFDKEDGYYIKGVEEILINSFESFKTHNAIFQALIKDIEE